MMKNEEKNDKLANNPEETKVSFADLGISDSILDALKRLNLETPTPIQRKTIPTAIEGKDLIGVAQTGTGKTFAFGIPMLQRLGSTKGQALILTPTRELAQQVEESLKKLGESFGLRTAVLIGGDSFDRQLFNLRRKPHVVVATPGRLIDHLKRRTFKLERVNILVLDEADMMLDMGFAPQINEILMQAPEQRQTMLFSATMPAAIVNIASKYMKLPVSIEVTRPGTTVEGIDQEIFIIKNEDRFTYLEKVLKEYEGSVLVFVRTKHSVKQINVKLKSLGHKSVEIHSNLSLAKRRAALNGFKSKKERILVATDVAARGLDINNIELVVNYNLPDSTDDYVHRIGRTGRAGLTGKAISFATPSQLRDVRDIERLINKTLKLTPFTTFNAESTQRETRSNSQGRGQRQRGLSLNNRFKANRTRDSRSTSRTASRVKDARSAFKPESRERSYMNPKFFSDPLEIDDRKSRSDFKRKDFSSRSETKRNFSREDRPMSNERNSFGKPKAKSVGKYQSTDGTHKFKSRFSYGGTDRSEKTQDNTERKFSRPSSRTFKARNFSQGRNQRRSEY